MARMKELWAMLDEDGRKTHEYGGPGSIGIEVVVEESVERDEVAEEVGGESWVFV
jgi:hypothetical protein